MFSYLIGQWHPKGLSAYSPDPAQNDLTSSLTAHENFLYFGNLVVADVTLAKKIKKRLETVTE